MTHFVEQNIFYEKQRNERRNKKNNNEDICQDLTDVLERA